MRQCFDAALTTPQFAFFFSRLERQRLSLYKGSTGLLGLRANVTSGVEQLQTRIGANDYSRLRVVSRGVAFLTAAVAVCVALWGLVLLNQSTQKYQQLERTLGLITSLQEGSTTTRRWLIDAHLTLPLIREHLPHPQAEVVSSLLAMLSPAVNAGGSLDQRQLAKAQLTQLAGGVEQNLLGLERRAQSLEHRYYASLMVTALAILLLILSARRMRGSQFDYLLNDQLLFENAPLALRLVDREGYTLRVNSAFENISGYSRSELEGRIGVVEQTAENSEGMQRDLSEQGHWVGEQHLRHKDGSYVSEKFMCMAVGKDPTEPDGYLTMSMDSYISDNEKRLMLWQAHHDNLTKLPNLNLLHERLSMSLVSARQEERRGAVISVDIDGFQRVNDSFGHAVADRVLAEVAMRLAMCAREGDTVARTGGDVFAVAMFDIGTGKEADQVARDIIESVRVPVVVDAHEIFLTASAGIVLVPDDGVERGELLQKADAARFEAKQRGGDQVIYFENALNQQAARRLELETHLRHAISNNELVLHFQPVIDLTNGAVKGAEALLRWQSDELGFVSPGEFIPVAENSGLIVEIGEWVVTEVRRHLAAWRAMDGWPECRISLNVSARQIMQVEHAHQLLAALGETDSDWLTVELTESALLEEEAGREIFLNGVKHRGIKLALDDFGTGYSSISYLRDFNFDVLKIDKSFIDKLEAVREYGLVASFIAMGRILGMQIVAEGVEEEAQIASLRQVGCDYVQGYYYSKPLPAKEFEAFVLAAADAEVQRAG